MIGNSLLKYNYNTERKLAVLRLKIHDYICTKWRKLRPMNVCHKSNINYFMLDFKLSSANTILKKTVCFFKIKSKLVFVAR